MAKFDRNNRRGEVVNSIRRDPGPGRYTEWEKRDPEKTLDAIYMWASEGRTDYEIADLIGIGETTFNRWKKQIPEVRVALMQGKDQSNGKLYKRAMDFALGDIYVKKQKVVVIDGEPRIVDYEEQVPPNAAMMKFWLLNRMPEKFKEQTSLNVEGRMAVYDEREVQTDMTEFADTYKEIVGFQAGIVADNNEEDNEEE